MAKSKRNVSSSLNKIPKEQLQQYKRLFDLIDHDQDGKITSKDLKSTILSNGVEGLDDNSIMAMTPNGELNMNTFLKLMVSKLSGFSDAMELKDAFAVFGDGDRVDCKRLRAAIEESGSDISAEDLDTAIGDFTKENQISGEKKFLVDKFIEAVSN